MKVIKLKPYFMNRYAYLNLAAIVVFLTLVFIMFDNMSREDRFAFGSLLTGGVAIFGIFLNRFEPEVMVLNYNEFEISYFNFKFFAKANTTYNKNQVEVADKGDMLLLIYENKVIGKVREKATDTEEWILLRQYFVQDIKALQV